MLEHNPFETLDQDGVGELIEIGVNRGRAVKPGLEVGICGEHGGDPASIAFCHRAGLDYVSCSPFRVPVARLAAAQAALAEQGGAEYEAAGEHSERQPASDGRPAGATGVSDSLRDVTPLPDLLHGRSHTGPVREQRPVYVDLLPPCNAGCPAGENIQAWLSHTQAGRHEQAWRRARRRQSVSRDPRTGLLPPVRERLQPREPRQCRLDPLGRAVPR